MEITKGYLLISDITGYTQFLVESELLHAKEILDTLLETGIRSIRAPIRVLNTRGDAILAFVAEDNFLQPQTLIEAIESIYFEYRHQLNRMILNTTCTCRACANMGTLDLKLFLHYGEYIEQQLDGAVELQGADVILANRLMKNRVKEVTGLGGYALITKSAIEAMGAEALVQHMIPHEESYEHFGEVSMRIWNLPAAWEREVETLRQEISPDKVWIFETINTDAPPWVAWDYATDTEQKRIYYDMQRVERVGDAEGPVGVGSKYHCYHEMGEVTFTITDWNPPVHFVSDEIAMGIPIQFTMRIQPQGDGSQIQIMYGEPRLGDKEELEPLFRDAARDALHRLAAILETSYKYE
jgi:hypothetical protein